MQTASFVMIKGPLDADGKVTMRPYTPTSTNGKFEGIIGLPFQCFIMSFIQ